MWDKSIDDLYKLGAMELIDSRQQDDITISMSIDIYRKLIEDKKTYIKMLKIKSIKELSLTATLKLLENITNDKNVISNDNIEHFGEIIDKKSLLWAINNNIVCDYLIQTIISEKNELEDQLIKFNILEDNDKRLFLSAYASLKSISDGNSHHILIYSNNKNNSLKIIEFVKLLLNNNYFNIPDLYYSNYHSEMRSTDQKNIINNFERTKFGIITCVYCLSEGWDFPTLDAVVFAENMSSNIRIVQSALRASRKNKNEPDKITKIILPILNQDNWLDNNENSDLKKVKEIIYQIGLEDESIVQKIKVLKMTIEKKVEKDKDDNQEYNRDLSNFGEYDEELTKKIKLKTIKRTIFGTSYEKARKIIFAKNIKNKEDYFNLSEKDIRLSDEPEITYKGEFKNWIEYLSIERIYYDYEECKKKVNEYLSLYPHIKNNFLDIYSICKELCKLDSKFPPNGLWIEYYDITDLKDIFKITNIKKKINLNI
jgi:predicted helicase